MRSDFVLRFALPVAVIAVVLCGATVQAASTAAVRSAKAAELARSTGEMGGGGYAGMVPGIALTDPVSIATGINVPTTFNYGDGTTVTYQPGETPSHTYTQPGLYKPVIASKTLGVVSLAIVVPFDGNQPNVFGMGVINQYDSAGALTGALEFLPVFDGTATLDFGDGTAPVTVDSSVNPTHVYAKPGVYTAVLTSTNGGASQSGSIRFTAPLSDKNDVGKLPGITITSFDATPNPAAAGGTVTFSGAFSSANISGEISGTLDFGDGSEPFTASGSNLPASLKGQTTHTYAADGVYTASLAISGGGAAATSDLYIVVGSGTAVNPLDGLITSASVDTTGTASLRIIVTNLAGATTASTEFTDTLGRQAPVEGLLPTRTFTAPTISVATTVAKDAAGTALGKIRKMVAIGGRVTGDSGALADPLSSEVKIKKLAGKFLFGKDTADLVSVSGTIQLPAGFNPAQTGGNVLVIGVGNIVDSVTIDGKGKALTPNGAKGSFKKVAVKYPKLTGAATGGEIARVDVSVSIPNMDVAGFDTEGITNTRRADEAHLKVMPRFVQVSLLFAGVPYEVYAPVLYKLSPKGDAGQLAGRKQ